jgi:simple sugar transport system ATP-binding protein
MLGRSVSLHREGAALGLVSADDRVASADGGPTEHTPDPKTSAPALQIEGATVLAPDGHRLLDELSIAVQRGELVGVAGVEGNGQAALVDLLTGVARLDAGSVLVAGTPLRPGHGHHEEIGIVPADRQSGCVLELSIAENLVLDRPEDVMRRGIISRRLMRDRARQLVEEFDIVTPSVDVPVGVLSGGNQQRVVLARELSRRPAVLVSSQPTQGLDVGAMEDVWTRLRSAARDGVGILLISTDLDEILALSDRVAVISRGRIVGEMPRGQVDHEKLGRLMGGMVA